MWSIQRSAFFCCFFCPVSQAGPSAPQGQRPCLSFPLWGSGLASELGAGKERSKRCLFERKGNQQTRVQGGDAPAWRSRHLQRCVRLSRSFPKRLGLLRKPLSSAKAGVRLGSGLSQRPQHWGCGPPQQKMHPSPLPPRNHLSTWPARHSGSPKPRRVSQKERQASGDACHSQSSWRPPPALRVLPLRRLGSRWVRAKGGEWGARAPVGEEQ